jgi:peptidoglycan hydrolase FlgJ
MNPVDLNIKGISRESGVTNVASKKNEEDIRKIEKACKDFEAIFTYQLLKTMRRTVPKNSVAGISSGKETYNMLMDQKVAEDLANKGSGLGLQKMLFEQLTRNYPKEIVAGKVK